MKTHTTEAIDSNKKIFDQNVEIQKLKDYFQLSDVFRSDKKTFIDIQKVPLFLFWLGTGNRPVWLKKMIGKFCLKRYGYLVPKTKCCMGCSGLSEDGCIYSGCPCHKGGEK